MQSELMLKFIIQKFWADIKIFLKFCAFKNGPHLVCTIFRATRGRTVYNDSNQRGSKFSEIHNDHCSREVSVTSLKKWSLPWAQIAQTKLSLWLRPYRYNEGGLSSDTKNLDTSPQLHGVRNFGYELNPSYRYTPSNWIVCNAQYGSCSILRVSVTWSVVRCFIPRCLLISLPTRWYLYVHITVYPTFPEFIVSNVCTLHTFQPSFAALPP